ncbi:MAG TPA: hypothetical protein VI199_09070, partial [Novosphingobium sp.]
HCHGAAFLPDDRLQTAPDPAPPPDGAEPDQLVRAAVEAAVGAAWAFFTRTAAQGLDWDDIHGCASQADYRARLAAEPGLLLETCQALLDYDSGLTAPERAACRRVVAIADALALRGPAQTVAPTPPIAPPSRSAAPADAQPASPPEPVVAETATPPPHRSRAGLWISAVLVLVGTGTALGWLWSKQPGHESVGPRAAPAAISSQAGAGLVVSTRPVPPAPAPSTTARVEPAAKAGAPRAGDASTGVSTAVRATPSATATPSPRPTPNPTSSPLATPGPAGGASTAAPAPARATPAPVPAAPAAPQPIATAG